MKQGLNLLDYISTMSLNWEGKVQRLVSRLAHDCQLSIVSDESYPSNRTSSCGPFYIVTSSFLSLLVLFSPSTVKPLQASIASLICSKLILSSFRLSISRFLTILDTRLVNAIIYVSDLIMTSIRRTFVYKIERASIQFLGGGKNRQISF